MYKVYAFLWGKYSKEMQNKITDRLNFETKKIY